MLGVFDMQKLKCPICDTEFIPEFKNHYISRNDTRTSTISTAFISSDEPILYDTFDCPQCGCQVRPQERKRFYLFSDRKEDKNEAD